ncbi:MAG: ribonuclease PH [Coriobacteriia bacterium]|nr:ribonuclease PH [Coriobacteriia bacterium]
MEISRSFGRAPQEIRPVTLERDVMKHALGSCFVKFGDTHVLCSATIDEHVPAWLKGKNQGWVTAEYAMLPASTSVRSRREINGQKGRSQEIQRLIGRSLRTVCDLQHFGEISVTLDCDVIQADGGTRTASITGAWVALHDALMKWVEAGRLARLPLNNQVVALSVGMVDGVLVSDLDYSEDSVAEIDMNLVYTSKHEFIEIQGTGERVSFSRQKLNDLLDIAQPGLLHLLELQNKEVDFFD